jgi:hypothetical protein
MKYIIFAIVVVIYVCVSAAMLVKKDYELKDCSVRFMLLSEVWCREVCTAWQKEYGAIYGSCGVSNEGVAMKNCTEWLK